MPQLKHTAFIHQPNGVIYVGDGTTEAVFDDPALFVETEPGYALPAGIVAVNYEVRGGREMLLLQGEDGGVERGGDPAPYAGYVSRIAEYRAFLDARADPLFGVTDLAAARAVLERAVAREFSLRVEPLFAQYAGTERETWFRQLEEARSAEIDPAAATPFLDAILLTGETKADLATRITTLAGQYEDVVAPYVRARRRHVADIHALATIEELRAYDIKAGWPVS